MNGVIPWREIRKETEHPAPWWFCLALRFFPERCREIPEAQNPDRIVLRQVALIGRYLYLQQFASGEDPRWGHSHQWKYCIALGLWGSYLERRITGCSKVRRAPYFYTIGKDTIHQVRHPSPGHTSLFLGVFRNDDLKYYYDFHEIARSSRLWSEHVKKMVRRI